MSDSMQVFIEGKNLPSIDEFRRKLEVSGLVLEPFDSEGVSTLSDVEGFWPGISNGKESGFEFDIGLVDDDDLDSWDVERSELGPRDIMIEVTFRTEQELVASVIVVDQLCKDFDGLAFDDDDVLTINSSNCSAWKESILVDL